MAKRTEQATLQAYLDEMGTLLLDRDLREPDENSDVRKLARGRTLVVFDALSAFRQVRALRFLYEADLIQATPDEQPVISLNNTSLPDIQLPGRAFLRGTRLQQANLSGANLDLRRPRTKDNPRRRSRHLQEPGRSAHSTLASPRSSAA